MDELQDENIIEEVVEELVNKICLQQHSENKGLKRVDREKHFDPEYYSLPPIEKLCISVKENAKMEKFGVVDLQIDFIVKIKPFDNIPHLGYDTVLFDSERNPLGEIFEIFGTVTNTMYAVRFNSKEEAAEKMPVGREVFYALDENITKKVFPNKLVKLKNWDRIESREEESGSEEVFSDDEAERQYLAKKRQKTRDRTSSQNTTNGCSVKKKTRSDFRGVINPFSPHHKQWRQHHIHPSNQHLTYQQSVSPFYGQPYQQFPNLMPPNNSYTQPFYGQPPPNQLLHHPSLQFYTSPYYFNAQRLPYVLPFQPPPPPPPPNTSVPQLTSMEFENM